MLEEIKNDPLLKRVPVVILTSSRQEEDVVHGVRFGCQQLYPQNRSILTPLSKQLPNSGCIGSWTNETPEG